MNIVKVTDVYDRELEVDMDTKKMTDYDNGKKKITYNVEIVEDGKGIDFWTDIVVDGTVDTIEERLKTWNNVVRIDYAFMVDGKASQNDPDGELWNRIVKMVKDNPERFFTKNGNWRKDSKIDPLEIVGAD